MSLNEPAEARQGLGDRVRELRLQQRLSQTQLAAEAELSGSYVSLIESGRRKATGRALQAIADRLGSTLEYLESGHAPGGDTAESDLRFAELALRVGDAAVAEERFASVLEVAGQHGRRDLSLQARAGLAGAKEAQGHIEEAIDDYEALAQEDDLPGTVGRATLLMALCRAYSECGDLNRAVEVGESALVELRAATPPPLATDSIIALTSTLVGCYYERGDLTRAQSLVKAGLAAAANNGSPQARAAALWNASLVVEARGDQLTARAYVERALALYGETDNARATALLKVTYAWLLLRETAPHVSDAEELLRRALAELPVVGTSVDIAYAETELARCHLLVGDWQTAIRTAEAALVRLGDKPRLEAARTRLLIGHAHLQAGDHAAAAASYHSATAALRESGAVRQAASAWRELAEALALMGRTEEALDAYREASDTGGVAGPLVQVLSPTRSSEEGRTAAEPANSKVRRAQDLPR